MWDSFEPFQKLDIQNFSFRASRFEIWKGGQKINHGETTGVLVAKKTDTLTGTKASILFDDQSLFSELSQENEFDIFITSTDRLQLVKVPSSGNGDGNMGIMMFKMNIGETRGNTDFKSNEPYCCNLFLQEGQISKVTFSFSSPDKLIEFYADENIDDRLNLIFQSSDHIRYENGLKISGPHGGASRAIKVEPNIMGGEGYTITIFNTDGDKASVQMSPKQMKIISADDSKIEFRGFGNDERGFSFADYGITIYHFEGRITKCILHMFDRNVDIEYFE